MEGFSITKYKLVPLPNLYLAHGESNCTIILAKVATQVKEYCKLAIKALHSSEESSLNSISSIIGAGIESVSKLFISTKNNLNLFFF